MRKKLPDMGLDSDFLAMTPAAQATTAKVNKWGYIELKSICMGKINKMKMQLIEWDKNIFRSHIEYSVNIQNVKNAYNSTKANKQPNFKNGQKN